MKIAIKGNITFFLISSLRIKEKETETPVEATETSGCKMIAKSNCVRIQRLALGGAFAIPNEEVVKAYFEQFGSIVCVHLKGRNPNGFVVFSTIAEAQKALDEEIHSINGCNFKVAITSRVPAKARQDR